MNQINQISLHPLRRIDLDEGNILHAIKKSDDGYVDFGEAYFSIINFNSVKAWKLHKSMTLNLVVPVGKVRFVFSDKKGDSFKEVEIGEDNYERINVPPGIWFGFKGLHKSHSLIMNIADIEHDPEEVLRKSINEFKYTW